MKIKLMIDESVINAAGDNDIVVETADFENIFNVYLDKKGNYVFNINSGIYITFDKEDIFYYRVSTDFEAWPIISYKLYGTTHLVWLLYKLNNISAKDVFKPLSAGQLIKVISDDSAMLLLDLLYQKD